MHLPAECNTLEFVQHKLRQSVEHGHLSLLDRCDRIVDGERWETNMATTVDSRRETASLIGSDKVDGTAVYGADVPMTQEKMMQCDRQCCMGDE